MPSYTLGDIMSKATRRIGRRADITTSEASAAANEAYFEVYHAISPFEGELTAVSSLTTGENKIELPSDYHEPISFSLIYQPSWGTSSSDHSSHVTLKLISLADADNLNPQPSGVPEKIAFFNSWVELYPSPNSAYSFQLRYRGSPSEMTSLTDVPSVSTPWRHAVFLKTREILAADIGNFDMEAKASSDYLRYVSSIKSPRAIRQSGEMDQSFHYKKPQGGRRRV